MALLEPLDAGVGVGPTVGVGVATGLRAVEEAGGTGADGLMACAEACGVDSADADTWP
jgi:hypothetical protein